MATPIAADQATILKRAVCDVVPVVGLLAETAEAGLLTAADCEALRTLAGLDEEKRALMLASAGLFTSTEGPVDVEQRKRLLERLDLYGINFAIAHLQANPHLATGELVRLLFAASGFPGCARPSTRSSASGPMSSRPGGPCRAWRRPPPPARQATGTCCAAPSSRSWPAPNTTGCRCLRRPRRSPPGRCPARGDGVRSRAPGLDRRRRHRPGPARGPRSQLRSSAIEAASRWRAFANGGATPAQARVANVVHRGFHLLAQRLG
ncbi:hypothetical protein GCM10029992_44880 [Glycomyces albus]